MSVMIEKVGRALWSRRALGYVLLAILYFLLLTDGGTYFKSKVDPLQLTFNSMLDHLLQGRFDVDYGTVGKEGFLRNGLVYAYWGPLPALFRLPIMPFRDWKLLDISGYSCFIALLIAVAAKLWTLRIVRRERPDAPRWLTRALFIVLLFSGAQMTFLKPSIYQEVCLWAGAFGAIFVAAAVQGTLRGVFSARLLVVMAVAAGLTLLTRVSIAVGLYVAMGLLGLVELRRAGWRTWFERYWPAALILAVAILVTGFVNYQRWGNPLTFANYDLYLYNLEYTDRVARTHAHGLFNLARIPFGIMYYFLPVWMLHGGDGTLLFSQFRVGIIDVTELPPSSFLLTDALLLIFFGAAIKAVVRPRGEVRLDRAFTGALMLGLSVSPLLMLTAISMNFRYRMDFYPMLEFGAFIGLAALLVHGREVRWQARRPLITAAVILSVLSSVLVLYIHKISEFGPPEDMLKDGVADYYWHRTQRLFHKHHRKAARDGKVSPNAAGGMGSPGLNGMSRLK